MNSVIGVSLFAVVVLAVVHLFSGRLRFLDVTPRSVWLSIAGGISVAHVFVHLLPDLAEEQETIRRAAGESFSFLPYHVYLVALAGLAAFYGGGSDHERPQGGVARGAREPLLGFHRRRRLLRGHSSGDLRDGPGRPPVGRAFRVCSRLPLRIELRQRGDPVTAPAGAGAGKSSPRPSDLTWSIRRSTRRRPGLRRQTWSETGS